MNVNWDRSDSTVARYAVLVSLLSLFVLCPIAAWLLHESSSEGRADGQLVAVESHPVPAAPVVDQPIGTSPVKVSREPIERDEAGASPSVEPAPATRSIPPVQWNWSQRATAVLRPWLPATVVSWGLGVVLCSLRPLVGWYTQRKLTRVGVTPVPEAVEASVARLSARLCLRQSVRVLESSLAQMPLVAGYLRPVILLPISLAANIPVTQVEAILAHELAHVAPS